MRVLSGIQSTGRPHWGNYFGAIRQYIDLQDDHDGFYFIADWHALTTIRDPAELRQNVIDTATDMMALGLDPARATIFVQSHVPQVAELSWILTTLTPMGLLERCVSYKDKRDKGIAAEAGLFTYPVLMAADILAYDPQIVPVGADQIQHIEVCRDLVGRFHHQYGETFVMPKAKTLDIGAKVVGTDGEKMSKSYGNTLPIFGDVKKIRKQIMRITTDSRPMDQPKDPAGDPLYELYRLFATDSEITAVEATYRAGGFGYGEIKQAVAEVSERYFEPARQRRLKLEADPSIVADALSDGGRRAREVAAGVLDRVRVACGLR